MSKADRRRLGDPIPGLPGVDEGRIPALKLLRFLFTEPYTALELYEEFVPYFPEIQRPTIKTNFVDYSLTITSILIYYIIDTLDYAEEKEELSDELRLKKANSKKPPKEFSAPPPKKGRGKKKGGVVPEELDFLQQMTKQSYNIENPQENINGWILKKWTPTMKFWMKGNDVIVGVRGTKTTEDVMTWGTVPLNTLDTTIVYKRDKAAVQQFQQKYPKDEYNYFAVGHSLGGAIIDNLIRAGLIKEAVSYNPAIQYRDINGGLPNRRIYYGNDPLYRLMGWWDRKAEHREAENRTWGQFLSTFTTPGVALEALSAHNLKNFTGGLKRVQFRPKINEF